MHATSIKSTKSTLYIPYQTIAGAFSLALSLILLSGLSARADLSGLVGYWPFNEGSGTTTADITNHNNGALIGGPVWVPSPLGSYGLEFGGGDDYVDVDDPATGILDFDETQSFSFGAWIKPAVVDGIGRRFISKISGSENIGYALGLWNGSQGAFADVSDGTTELSTADFFDIPVRAGEWSFVVAVVDRAESTLRVYVNGVEAEATLDIFGLGSLASAASLNFGRASGNSAKSFAGVLDEVRIYNRALSAADVQELFASMQTPVSLVNQPASQTVMEGQPVTFSSTFSGSPPYFLQWFSNAVAIAGATNLSYTILSTTRGMNGSIYSLTVSNLLPSSITSTNATLTVESDVTPPTLLSVLSRFSNQVAAVFSEAVSPATAEAAANYVITNGAAQMVTVTSAALGTDGGRTVTLTTSAALTEGTDYVLVVAGVEDLATVPNTIAPGTAHGFRFNSLVGYWPMEETSGTTAADLSGYGHDGTLVNGPSPVDGKVGKALRFDGSNDYVDVGDPSTGVLDFDTTHSFSFGAWIKPAELTSTGKRFISKRNDADVGYELSVISRSGHGLFTELGDGLTAPSTYDAGILVPLNIDQWYHAMTVVDRSANQMRLYLDGNLQGTVDISGLGSVELNEPLNFGRASGNSAKSFAGVIDEVRIYSRALTLEEIKALATPPGPSPQFLPPTLSGGKIHLNWTGTGQLEWSPTVRGPWTSVTPAPAPPYSEDTVPGESRFFRLRSGL